MCVPRTNIQVLEMNLYPMKRIAPVLLAAAVVAGCGGGTDDNEAGAPAAFNVQPSALALKGGSPTTCYDGFAVEAFVYGGTAPYYINNTYPDVMILNKNKIDSAGGSFTVTMNGGCFASGTIVIVDKLNRQTTLVISSVLGTAS
jgi:hypothetical protein